MKKYIIIALVVVIFLFSPTFGLNSYAYADSSKNYYTVYADEDKKEILFLKGDDVSVGDNYLSHDNKLYEIVSVDEEQKIAIAKFLKIEKLPEYNVTPKKITGAIKANAAVSKKVGVYHTHNDESYFTPDGVDSVYGKGGIHDVGKALCDNLSSLGIQTIYREDLHLPHNSGAYTRSQVTASAILDSGANAIFDIHRDSTKRSEYMTEVDGKTMSSVRMVVGASSANFEENKNFAYSIKAYADKAFPGLIKDIYIGKGNYNQQLSSKAMLFEIGCENIEKKYAIASTEPLSKVIDVVLYGSENASKKSLENVSLSSQQAIAGIVNDSSSVNSNSTLYYVFVSIGIFASIFGVALLVSKKFRYKVARFFSEMFAGIFGKKSTK